MKRIGLMGCGTVAGYGHLPALKNAQNLELGAIFDPNEQRLKNAQERFGVEKAFTESKPFFESGLDAVSICSPAPCHHQNVLDAARHGMHVLCEKPLAQSAEEGEEMVSAMENAGRMLFTGYCYRFSPAAMKIRELVRDGSIGKLRSLRLIFIWNCHGKYARGAEESQSLNERRVGRMLEGGPMVDCGSHQIDLARWWTGSEIVAQDSFGAWLEDYEAPDHQYLHLEHDNGAHTMVEISYSYCHTAKDPIHHFHYYLIGTEGVIRYHIKDRLFELRNSQGTTQLEWADVKSFEGMYDAFAQALVSGHSDLLPMGLDGLTATRIARKSLEQALAKRR